MEEPSIEVIERSRRREVEKVLVTLDANRDVNNFAPLNWVLNNLVRHGDAVVVLAVIYHEELPMQPQSSCWSFGKSVESQSNMLSKGDIATKSVKSLHEEISNKKELYKRTLRPFYERYQSKGVRMEVKIAAGFLPTYITVHEAHNIGASWIVLARNLRIYKKDIADNSGCKVAVIRRNNVGRIVTSESKLHAYNRSSENSNNRVSYSGNMSRISSGEGHANTQMPAVGVPLNYFMPTKGDLTEDSRTPPSAPQTPSSSRISKEIARVCSVCENRISARSRMGPPREFSPDEIETITNRFPPDSIVAGNGKRIWQIYKGIFRDESEAHNVLVRKFGATCFDTKFRTEIEVLGEARHRNILNLIGFCKDKSCPVTVYEYACNGTLNQHLYSENETAVLSWQARRKIATGVGKGLRYLNEECGDGAIVHGNIKPSNIFVTHDFLPLISNFGSARRLRTDEICTESGVWGSAGYVAPEYAERGMLSVKADAYSFGVLLLELITGRKALDFSRAKDQRSIVEWARPLIDICAFDELLDPRVVDSVDMYELYCMISAASACIRRDPRSRHSLGQVVSILKGDREMIIRQSAMSINL